MVYDNNLSTYYLNKGVDKLIKYGFDTFELFADECGMSFCDRNRVIAKCRIITGDQKYKEMPCPDDLKAARWEFYTKKMGYDNGKARDMLSKVDSAGQYNLSFNVNDLARAIAKGV